MAQHYSDQRRATDKWSLPDVETFRANYAYCPECSSLVFSDHYTSDAGALVADCTDCKQRAIELTERGWWYWFCLPGCMPDSEPFGPFSSEADALSDARQYSDDDSDSDSDSDQ